MNIIGLFNFILERLLFWLRFALEMSSGSLIIASITGANKYLFGLPHEYGFGSGTSAFTIARKYQDNLKNKTIIVTGANIGLGYTTTEALAENGCHVIMACRDEKTSKESFQKIKQKYPNSKITLMQCDLNDIKSVETFAQNIISKNLPVHVLINNAGVAFTQKECTKQGYEKQFGVNYFGHYVLTQLLLPILHKNGTSEQPSRIINVSSTAHHFVAYDKNPKWDEVAFQHNRQNYSRFKAYGYSKSANILHAMFLTKYAQQNKLNVVINAVHPGAILNTSLLRGHMSQALVKILTKVPLLKTVEAGAATQVLLACHPKLNNVSGMYFEDCGLAKPSAAARDESNALALKKFSEKCYGQLNKLQ